MITDIPSSEEYENIGIDCLIQAYDNVFQIDNLQTQETSRESLWDYHQIVLRTAMILIHQGLKNLIKSKISESSALLLIDDNREDKSGDKSFFDFYSKGGDDLLKTFKDNIDEKKIDTRFFAFFEEIRVHRNHIVHGIGEGNIDPDEILELILKAFTYTLGLDNFWYCLIEKLYNHPGFESGEKDYDWEVYTDFNRIEHLNLYLGKGILKHHFSTDITARPYLCPNCTEKGEMITEKGIINPENKWTFLNPNEPTSTRVSCCVCLESFKAIREDCEKADCKGNVKCLLEEGDEDEPDIWVCLTCWNEEDKNNNG